LPYLSPVHVIRQDEPILSKFISVMGARGMRCHGRARLKADLQAEELRLIIKAARLFVALLALAALTAATATAQSLPTGWNSQDIGSVGANGAASGTFSSMSAKGAGADIWGTADAFRFVYTTLTGDGSVITQVTSAQYVNAWTKAGVMMRETLAPGSRHASMFVSPGKGLAFQRRLAANYDSTNTSGGEGTAPYFVKIKRAGNTFFAYRSLDGSNWTLVGSETIPMASSIYVGVAVGSHAYGALATATFASTSVSPGATITPAPVVTLPTPTPTTGSAKLRLLHWNVHHGGIGTDGRYLPSRVAALVASVNPDIVDFNEVDDPDQVAAILNALNAASGGGWKAYAAWKTVIMTRMSVNATSPCTFDSSQGWQAAHASVTVNGRAINLWTTHLDVDSGGNRLTEVGVMQSCAGAGARARGVARDFNMPPGSTG
jgi:hypothetical protein